MPPPGGFEKPPGFPAAACVLPACAALLPVLPTPLSFLGLTLSHSYSRLASRADARRRCPRLLRYRKRSPARGPAGWIILAGGVGFTVYGMIMHLWDIEERKCVATGTRTRGGSRAVDAQSGACATSR